MRVPRLISTLAALSAASLILAACGGEEEPTEESPDAGTEAPAEDDDGDTDDGDDDGDDNGDDGDAAAEGDPVSVGLVYDIGGRGDQSFNDAAAAGLDQASADFNIEASELEPSEGGENRGELLRLVSGEGVDLVFGVGFAFEEAMQSTAPDFPDVNYGFIDGFLEDLDADSNVVALGFAEHEGSFLVGAAAALKSENDHIGYIGGVEIPLIERFEAGFVAGAREVNPDIEIDITYISQPPDFSGFTDPASGREIALGMFSGGADVVYHAAGGSGLGLFEAAKEHSESSGSKVWAIGVDSDQYLTADEALQEYILTSMLKRVDVASYNAIYDVVNDTFEPGTEVLGLAEDGVGFALDEYNEALIPNDLLVELEVIRDMIVSGQLRVTDYRTQ